MPLLSLSVLLLITDSTAHFFMVVGNFYAYPEFAKRIS